MMRPSNQFGILGVLCLGVALAVAASGAAAAAPEALPTVEDATVGLERLDGLWLLHLDRARGRLLLELPPPDASGEIGRFLHVDGLSVGLGSNPVGLDRGQLGVGRVILLRRLGDRIVIESENLAYRALDAPADERLAVRQSFASSVIWAGPIAAESPDGRSLVEVTSFVVRDGVGVARRLQATGQGSFKLDESRSAIDPLHCFVFPENVELEAVLTFAADGRPGSEVTTVVPEPLSVSLVQHQSILRLPDEPMRPRRHDPRAGSFAIRFFDYATALDQPVERRWIVRHRLEPGEPLVYYVDRGAPEPVRSALIEGAQWWARAFEAAGFKDAFRVELLPEGVHPLDSRYHVIEWVHRATRGWSYGGGVIDPRSGEMLKAHVRLGSLRVRQDRLLFEGLLGVGGTGGGAEDDPIELALARLRQLSAHEVGHTLGLEHNFAASTYDDRASVMDYPAPRIHVGSEGQWIVDGAYGVGVGSWDLHAIRYAYAQYGPDGDAEAEERGLEALLREGVQRGLIFLSDEDARPAGAAQPRAALWDNGSDSLAELDRVWAVRRRALDLFGLRNLAPGRPLAGLEEVLAPVYFWHRYQLTAAAKLLGGLDYRHGVVGDASPPATPTEASTQRRALASLLARMEPAELDLPESLLGRLAPRPPDHPPNREQFNHATAPAFDALGAASTASSLVVAELLEPHRAARLVDFHRRDPELPAFEEVLEALVGAAFGDGATAGSREREIRREVQRVVVEGLVGLASSEEARPAVVARVEGVLANLVDRIGTDRAETFAENAHRTYLARQIRRRLDRVWPPEGEVAAAAPPPPGSPIGSGAFFSECSFGSP